MLVLLLMSYGVVVQTQLAAGADSTRWLKYPAGTIFIATEGLLLVTLLAITPVRVLSLAVQELVHRRRHWLRVFVYTVVGLIMCLLLSQFVFGSETGVLGVQPVEFAKAIMIFLAASTMWFIRRLREVHSKGFRENPGAAFGAALKLLGLAILAAIVVVAGVNDFSPIVIIGILIVALWWRVIPHPVRHDTWRTWFWRGLIILMVFASFIGMAWLHNNPPDYASWIPQHDRFRIWASPERYKEAAAQLLQALAAIQQGDFFTTSWFGRNAQVMTTPAIQDDFIAAFLLNRFGALGDQGRTKLTS